MCARSRNFLAQKNKSPILPNSPPPPNTPRPRHLPETTAAAGNDHHPPRRHRPPSATSYPSPRPSLPTTTVRRPQPSHRSAGFLLDHRPRPPGPNHLTAASSSSPAGAPSTLPLAISEHEAPPVPPQTPSTGSRAPSATSPTNAVAEQPPYHPLPGGPRQSHLPTQHRSPATQLFRHSLPARFLKQPFPPPGSSFSRQHLLLD